MKTTIVLLCLLIVSPAYAEELASKCALIPAHWQLPSIDVETLSEWSEAGLKTSSGEVPQQALNRYLAILSDLWDARMALVYVELSTRLDESEKESFEKQQKEWLEQRIEISLKASVKERGGSVEASMFSNAYIEFTKQRYNHIYNILKAKGLGINY